MPPDPSTPSSLKAPILRGSSAANGMAPLPLRPSGLEFLFGSPCMGVTLAERPDTQGSSNSLFLQCS